MNYPDDFINKIVLGDCINVMQNIPDNSIDLVVTDPPYSLGYNFENDKLSPKEQENFMIRYGEQFHRILKIGGTICIFMEQKMSHYLYFSMLKNNLIWQNEIIWNRDGGQMPSKKFGVCHENIHIYTKGNFHGVFNLDDLRVKSKYADMDKRLNPKGKNPGDVWYVPALFGKKLERLVGNDGKALHPTQKPIDIVLPLILAYSNPKDIILDSFAGSGTTEVACIKTNRRFIGIEKDEKYFEIAKQRIMEASNE